MQNELGAAHRMLIYVRQSADELRAIQAYHIKSSRITFIRFCVRFHKQGRCYSIVPHFTRAPLATIARFNIFPH